MNYAGFSSAVRTLVFWVLLVLLDSVMGGQVTSLFSKVGGSFVEKECLLSTVVPATTGMDLRRACSSICMLTASCSFFCSLTSTGTCALFKAFVAVRWQGHQVSTTGTKYDACYTSWGDPRDIVKTNSPFTYSTALTIYYPQFATDGYACVAPAYFVTGLYTNSFSQIDLQQTTRVQKVIAATAWPRHIIDMDVILSNTSDFNLGQKIGRVVGDTPAWSTYTIVTNSSVAGRYITFYQIAMNHHGYADIQIIPQP
ncbi:uncharacterized protein LOC125177933 [Hyalella azteca]|uniref:Uncharacterized protein LOC125177933 n=1 Tax=Hyalella azteca TaxID=294128 RepID=A0A979FIS0_HYAAZ|nr:uncharacterized protein LOC125177933 [Hyalella azteca]